jgi:hypothetical protein
MHTLPFQGTATAEVKYGPSFELGVGSASCLQAHAALRFMSHQCRPLKRPARRRRQVATYDVWMRTLAARGIQCKVLSVHYPLAPENPYPAGR